MASVATQYPVPMSPDSYPNRTSQPCFIVAPSLMATRHSWTTSSFMLTTVGHVKLTKKKKIEMTISGSFAAVGIFKFPWRRWWWIQFHHTMPRCQSLSQRSRNLERQGIGSKPGNDDKKPTATPRVERVQFFSCWWRHIGLKRIKVLLGQVILEFLVASGDVCK